MHYERDLLIEGLSMCLVMTNPVEILAVRHVKQGIEAEGFRTGFIQSLRFMVYHL